MNNHIKVIISGKNPNYFLKELIKNKINIYDIEKNKNKLIIVINSKDLELLKKIKTTYKISIINYYGISRLKQLLKKYNLLLMSFVFGILIIILLSHLIWEVEVINPNQKLTKIIKEDLKEYGIKKYHLSINYKKIKLIKEKILKKEKDILEWIEIEKNGTKYLVKIEERKKKETQDTCNSRHIISKKNALILEINASQGEIVKKKNDYVSKGEIIVSGLIHNKDTIVTKKCSQGTIYGEVWYKVKVSIPKTKIEERLTNNKNYGLSINIFKKNIELIKKYQTTKKTKYNILDNKTIPLEISLIKNQEIKLLKKRLSTREIETTALKSATKEIKKKLNKDENIITKKILKKQEKNSTIVVEIFFKIKENITDYLDITNIDIEKENKKEE